jgi:GTP 3',8-cyclase
VIAATTPLQRRFPQGTYLRLSLTDRCNLRCTYCLPEQARFAPDRASTAELLRLTELVVHEAQVRKIRLTGGEPTVHPELIAITRHCADLVGDELGLTSNGVLLAPLLPALRAAGLRKLNISLDAVDEAGFQRHSRRRGVDQVLTAIRTARDLGFDPLKINAVAMRGVDLASLARYAIAESLHLRYIELMAIGVAREWQARAWLGAAEIRAALWDAGISLEERIDLDEPTSRVWTVPGIDAARCSIGFITTSSDPFCATCDRLRLTSQGFLHTCLFDETGVDLLSPLRDGDASEVRRRIAHAVLAKAPPAHFVRAGAMAGIGG